MKRPNPITLVSALLLLAAPSLRAEFLVLRIGENTAERISHWVIAVAAVIVILTLKGSRNKGGEGS
ncbi:MAG: hypothetical protein ABMA01_06445 [Chthoniobacteraceae bacterium]